MHPRLLLRIVAILFLIVGSLMLRFSFANPAPRSAWITHAGSVAEVTFYETPKAGRGCTVRIDAAGDAKCFALYHMQSIPSAQESLERLSPGTPIEIDSMPRERGSASDLGAQPLPMLELRRGGEVLFDTARDTDRAGASSGSSGLSAAFCRP